MLNVSILQSTCWASTCSEKLRRLNKVLRSEETILAFRVAETISEDFSDIEVTRVRYHIISKIKIFDRFNKISIGSAIFFFWVYDVILSSLSHREASRSSKRPEDSITFYDPRGDSHRALRKRFRKVSPTSRQRRERCEATRHGRRITLVKEELHKDNSYALQPRTR